MAAKKVLIVEDEFIIANNIKKIVEQFGYTVTSIAASAHRAIEKAKEDRPDIVIMDIKLTGEMDGIEASKQIRKFLDVPVVYLSAYTDKLLLERAKLTEPFGQQLHNVG